MLIYRSEYGDTLYMRGHLNELPLFWMGWFIVLIRGSQIRFSELSTSVPEDCFYSKLLLILKGNFSIVGTDPENVIILQRTILIPLDNASRVGSIVRTSISKQLLILQRGGGGGGGLGWFSEMFKLMYIK